MLNNFFKNKVFFQKSIKKFNNWKKNIFIRVFFYYFIFLLLANIFLMAPWSWNDPKNSWDFLNSLYTVVSAFSTTGLVIFDTGEDLTFVGQFIILLLMLIGGFSLLFFKIILFQFLKIIFFPFSYENIKNFKFWRKNFWSSKKITSSKWLSIEEKEQHFEKGYFNLFDTKKMFKIGITVFLFVQFCGAITLSFYFYSVPIEKLDYFQNPSSSIWSGIFHSVSATNNAGFDIFNDGIFFNSLESLHSHYCVQIVFMLQFLIGGLGLPLFFEIYEKISSKFHKNANKKNLSLFVKFTLIFYFSFAFLSLIFIFCFEYFANQQKIINQDFSMKIIFNTLSTRSAGFSTVNIQEEFSLPSKYLMSILMWIGCAPLSSGGGIKVTTLALVFLSLFLKTDKKQNMLFQKKAIFSHSVKHAYKICFFSLVLVFMMITVYLLDTSLNQLTNHLNLNDALFYATSSFGNVGLSTFAIGKKELMFVKIFGIILMLIGQIGVAHLFTYEKKNDVDVEKSYITLPQEMLF